MDARKYTVISKKPRIKEVVDSYDKYVIRQTKIGMFVKKIVTLRTFETEQQYKYVDIHTTEKHQACWFHFS